MISMFIGRERELASLKEFYEKTELADEDVLLLTLDSLYG